MKRLIVNADDFGMSEAVSRGIIDACKNGIVRASTVMANSPGLDSSLGFKGREAIDTGIHFTLTHGAPVSKAGDVPSIVDKKGSFYSKKRFYLRAILGLIDRGDVFRELSAQLSLLKNKGVKISHIDSHHHVHVLPGVRDAVAELALKNNIKYVRAPRSNGSFRSWFVKVFDGSHSRYWQEKGISSADDFAGFDLSAGPKLLEKWKSFLLNLPAGTTEVMVHPGELDGGLKDCYREGRAKELEVLKSRELLDICVREGIRLTGFEEGLR